MRYLFLLLIPLMWACEQQGPYQITEPDGPNSNWLDYRSCDSLEVEKDANTGITLCEFECYCDSSPLNNASWVNITYDSADCRYATYYGKAPDSLHVYVFTSETCDTQTPGADQCCDEVFAVTLDGNDEFKIEEWDCESTLNDSAACCNDTDADCPSQDLCTNLPQCCDRDTDCEWTIQVKVDAIWCTGGTCNTVEIYNTWLGPF